MNRACIWVVGLFLAPVWTVAASANWPQFRGPGGAGVAVGKGKLPAQFGPDKNVLWKVSLPAGLSSPCVWGDRIFLTAADRKAGKLETLCLDRKNGAVLWRKVAPVEKLERVHHTSSNAASTPATDGERVFVYFGSYGLLCYDFLGKELWKMPLPMPKAAHGSATSPVVADGLVFIKLQGASSSLLALSARTGAVVWRKDKLPFDAGYALPLIVRGHKDQSEVVIQGDRAIRAYALKDGKERWSRGGLFGAGIPSPVAAEGLMFFVVQFPGGDRDEPLKLPAFDDLLKKYDKNKNGKLEREEAKAVVIYSRDDKAAAGDIKLSDLFGALDRNGDGSIDRFEWGLARLLTGALRNSVFAVRPGASGELGSKDIAWQDNNSLPEIASPLCYQGRLYMVKHTPRGGIVSCLEAKTGKLLYREKLGPVGLLYASPVAGDGKIYVPSMRGKVVVLEAGDRFKVLARNDLGEAIGATPALVDGVMYVRTEKHLYAFRE